MYENKRPPLLYYPHLEDNNISYTQCVEETQEIMRQAYEGHDSKKTYIIDPMMVKTEDEGYAVPHFNINSLDGIKNRKGSHVSVNTIHDLLDNPFYYGEMRTFRGVMPHVYTPIITKELWDSCQEQKAIRAGDIGKYSPKPMIFKGIVRCGITNRTCPTELKKKRFPYVVCWKQDKTRIYVREEELVKHICSVLNRIKLPNNVLNELGQELKSSKGAERKFYAQEIKKLREEQDKLKEKLNTLFDLTLDGELDRETFDLKRNEIQVKINRLKNKVTTHEKADSSFDETILGLLDIATQAGNIFERSQNLDLKRLLLKFVFESLTLTEGVLTYKLKFPFNEFVNSNILMAQAAKAYEPKQTLINQGLTENDNENVQFGSSKSYEPQILDKKQEVTLKNATSLQIGDAYLAVYELIFYIFSDVLTILFKSIISEKLSLIYCAPSS